MQQELRSIRSVHAVVLISCKAVATYEVCAHTCCFHSTIVTKYRSVHALALISCKAVATCEVFATVITHVAFMQHYSPSIRSVHALALISCKHHLSPSIRSAHALALISCKAVATYELCARTCCFRSTLIIKYQISTRFAKALKSCKQHLSPSIRSVNALALTCITCSCSRQVLLVIYAACACY